MASAGDDAPAIKDLIAAADAEPDQSNKANLLISPAAAALMAAHRDRRGANRFQPELEVTVDRVKARYAAWYELFPRSAGTTPGKSGTFDDVIARLPYIQSPWGSTCSIFRRSIRSARINRKGPNNTLNAGPRRPGRAVCDRQ